MATWGWWSLFFGAFLDGLIGTNLFVPGEPFLLAAGYQLYAGKVLGVALVVSGAWLGDQSSYWLGRYYGLPLQRKLLKWQPRFHRPIARCRLFLRQNDVKVLLFARLLGPIAWVVPFVVGTQQMAWHRFTLYGSIGLFLGVGQFVLWGYLLAYGIEITAPLSLITWVKQPPIGFFALAMLLLIATTWGYRYYRQK